MSFIVSLSSSPPFILLWLQFFQFALKTMTWPWSLTFATLFLSFQDTIVFLGRLFFLDSIFWRAFAPLLMQFPVILLALSLNLNWLRWSSLGLEPRPRLSEPMYEFNGVTSMSAMLIIVVCGSTLMPLFILCAVKLWESIVYQDVNQNTGGVIRNYRGKIKWEGSELSIWQDSLARH